MHIDSRQHKSSGTHEAADGASSEGVPDGVGSQVGEEDAEAGNGDARGGDEVLEDDGSHTGVGVGHEKSRPGERGWAERGQVREGPAEDMEVDKKGGGHDSEGEGSMMGERRVEEGVAAMSDAEEATRVEHTRR